MSVDLMVYVKGPKVKMNGFALAAGVRFEMYGLVTVMSGKGYEIKLEFELIVPEYV
jgi:hypothetical protein